MSDEPPRRRSSMEITLSIPRDQLPPISVRDIETLGLDPTHPETLEGLARGLLDTDPPPTLDRCPACEDCGFCRGTGRVSQAQKTAYVEAARGALVEDDTETTPPSAA